MDDKYLSALVLDHVVFDCIEFQRKGFQNNAEAKFNLQINAGRNEDSNDYKVTLTLDGEKAKEYTLKISVSGYFHIEEDKMAASVREDNLINNNAVAILMPYLRSELSLLTAQPETDCVVMPVFNVNAMLSDEK